MIPFSVDYLIERWQQRFRESGMSFDELPTPGYSDAQLDALQQHLGINIHPSLSMFLQRVKLDTVSFRRLEFGGGMDYLTYLSKMNDGTYGRRATDDGLLNIGGGGAYTLLLENSTGKVLVHNMYGEEPAFEIADNLNDFLALATAIADTNWQKFGTKQEAIEVAAQYLDEHNIQQGRAFWTDLIRDAL